VKPAHLAMVDRIGVEARGGTPLTSRDLGGWAVVLVVIFMTVVVSGCQRTAPGSVPSNGDPDAMRARAIAEQAYLARPHRGNKYSIRTLGHEGSKWTFSFQEASDVEQLPPGGNWEVDVDLATGRADVMGRD
jgi:hypothetical protein